MNNNNTWSNYQSCCLTLQQKTKEETTVMSGNNIFRTQITTESTAKLQILQSSFSDAERELLIRAINNRTRERNYANLCLRLAEGEITDEEFDNEISDNEDRYVISFLPDTTPEQICLASALSKDVLDIDSEEDFRELFSISSASLSKALSAK